jgi:hypothetical protein
MALMGFFNNTSPVESLFSLTCFNDIAGSVAVDEVNNAVCRLSSFGERGFARSSSFVK